ncbi:MAG: serine/threonine protein kinase with repeat, partial [Myxococcales bacterium]|nr:serine/threonine protein kinase with repeat [Myxococcales bacterium]
QRDPAKRWPSMTALVAELQPDPRKRTVWPLVMSAGLTAAALGGAAVWILTHASDSQSCEVEASARVRAAWSPDAWTTVREHFAKAGRTYGDAAARQVSSALDAYAAHWVRLSSDVCTAERAQPGSQLASLRRACLDARLDALRGLAGLLTTEDKPPFVDHAQEMVGGLPDLGDCSDAKALLASPEMPPRDKVAVIAKLEVDLGTAIAWSRAGEYARASTDLDAIARAADALGWTPLRVRAHLALGENETGQLVSARDELLLAGELATGSHLDHDAARAWRFAATDAGYNKQTDAVAVLVPLARSAAHRTGDRTLEIDAEIATGRAWLRLRNYKDGLATCQAALASARGLDRGEQIDSASDCMIEALAPLGAFKELEPLLATRIESKTHALGADHPKVADLLAVRAQMEMLHGQLDLATKDGAASLEIRRRVYPPHHVKIAESLKVEGQLAAARGQLKQAKKLYEDALAIANQVQPEPLTLLAALHQALALISQASQDNASALQHYEDGISVMRKLSGNSSLELAMLLLNYGQLKAASDFAAGLAIIDEAHTILDKLHDPRAAIASGAMAAMEVDAKKWPEARTHAEEALAHPEVYSPDNIAELTWDLARAIVETKGDAKHARELALSARAMYQKLGPPGVEPIKKIDAWLRR